MAQTVKLKRSSVQGKVPLTTDLSLGEVAINTYDGNVFFKKSVSGTDTVLTVSVVGNAETFTNKTFDTAGSGNVFRINGTQISAVSGSGSAVLATGPSISNLTLTGTLTAGGGAGTNGQVLTSTGTGIQWSTVSAGLTITDDTSTNATRYLTFTSATSGTITAENVSSTKLTYNPSTGALRATTLGLNVAPSYQLDVNRGTTGIVARFSGSTQAGLIGANTSGAYFTSDASGNNAFLADFTGNFCSIYSNGSERFRVTSTGDPICYSTGYLDIPVGTTAQRPGTPGAGMIRYNSTLGQFEGYGTAWTGIGGAQGAGGDQVFQLNDQVVTTSYSIPSGKNASSAGPITINTGVTVTIPSGSSWVIG